MKIGHLKTSGNSVNISDLFTSAGTYNLAGAIKTVPTQAISAFSVTLKRAFIDHCEEKPRPQSENQRHSGKNSAHYLFLIFNLPPPPPPHII
jgi:hypothetical protein